MARRLDVLEQNEPLIGTTTRRIQAAREAGNEASADRLTRQLAQQRTQLAAPREVEEAPVSTLQPEVIRAQAPSPPAELPSVPSASDQSLSISTGPTQLELIEQQAAQELQKTTEQLREQAPLREQELRRGVDIMFEPKERLLGQQIQQRDTELGIREALAGTARGTRAALNREIRDQVSQEQKRALANQKQARINLKLAQAEGQDDAIIASLRDRFTRASAAVDEANLNAQRFEQEALAEQRQLAQAQQRLLFERQLEEIPTTGQRREVLLKQVELGGPEFIGQLEPSKVAELERQAGFSTGFLNAVSQNLQRAALTGSPVQRSQILQDELGNASAVLIREDGTIDISKLGKIAKSDPSFSLQKATATSPGGVFNSRTGKFEELKAPAGQELTSRIADFTQMFEGSSANAFGLDLAGRPGSDIRSSTSGEVIFAGPNGGWGNQIQIRDVDGNIHQYSHLQDIDVRVGDTISDASLIGTMGNTGTVLKSDGTVPSPEEKAAGRGTHLDYTVYRPGPDGQRGQPYSVDEAAQFAGVGLSKDNQILQESFDDVINLTKLSRDKADSARESFKNKLSRGDIAGAKKQINDLKLSRLSNVERGKIQSAKSALNILLQVRDLIGTPDNPVQGIDTGPVAGRAQLAQQLVGGVDPAFTRLNSFLSRNKALIIKDISGAAVSEQEAERLAQFIPDVTKQEDINRSDLDVLIKSLADGIDVIGESVELEKFEIPAFTGDSSANKDVVNEPQEFTSETILKEFDISPIETTVQQSQAQSILSEFGL